MAMTPEERAERLWNAYLQADYNWSADPSNDSLRKLARNKYQLYVGFCANNGLEYHKVKPF